MVRESQLNWRKSFLWVLVIPSSVFACLFWFGTLQQPLIDSFEFRQTQTALSALFMQPGLEGLLRYETPVVGAPWSIPFEFPLFQWLARQLASISGLNLSISGRLLSVVFGIGCIWPATRLIRRFSLSFTAIGLFIALYCTSSIYLQWNRAFLMESTALFFTLVSLDLYSQVRQIDSGKRIGVITLALAISLSLALLVKATTALPALMLMGGDWIWQSQTAAKSPRRIHQHLLLGSAMAVAFALLYSWTHHADAIKELNPIGSHLTSSALRSWNFGEPSQRWQPELWQEVVLERMLTPLAALPITALIGTGLWVSSKRVKIFLLACFFLTFAPLLIFTNLHIVHSYYQASNQIFLLMGLAGSTGTMLDQACRGSLRFVLVIAALTIVIIANLETFYKNDWPKAQQMSSNKLVVGKLIQDSTPSDSALIIFGDDWSSAFAYHSKRRAFTRPNWADQNFNEMKVLHDANDLVGGVSIGAVVSMRAINTTYLTKSCSRAHHHLIEEWHVYICEATQSHQSK